MPIKIKAFKTNIKGNYSILINESVFEMNESANLPNGLNLYCGELNGLFVDTYFIQSKNEMVLGDLPKGTLIGILNRIIHFDF